MTIIGTNGQNVEKSNLNTFTEIILFDSSTDINDLKKTLEHKSVHIITFDYLSHKTLSKENIVHQISDDYSTYDELLSLQKMSYRFSKWFNEKSLIEHMTYEEINLGQLLEVEFNYFIVEFLKKYLECSRIFQLNRKNNFIASAQIYKIMREFTDQVQVFDSQKRTKHRFDSVNFNIKIGNQYYTITISHSVYNKLKIFVESILHFLYRPKKNNSKGNILITEFDTLRYRNFFLTIKSSSYGYIFYGLRRPAVWSRESLATFKKSQCKIVSPSSLHVDDLNNSQIMDHKLTDLLKNEIILKDFFTINDTSFWSIIKPDFIDIFKKRIPQYLLEIKLAKKLLEQYNIKKILVWNEVGITERILVKVAKSLGISTALLQHGYFYDTADAYDMNEYQSVLPQDVDHYLVWGNIMKDYLLKNNVSESNITVIGNPAFDNLSSVGDLSEEFILLATSPPVKAEILDHTVSRNEIYLQTIKEICKIATRMNKKLIIKPHPSPDESDFNDIVTEINPNIVIAKTGAISNLIRSCQVMIVIDVTSVILEAQILKKPVISVDVKEYGWGTPSIFTSESCIRTKIHNLENILNNLSSDLNYKHAIIAKGTEFSSKYVSNLGNASQELIEFLNQ